MEPLQCDKSVGTDDRNSTDAPQPYANAWNYGKWWNMQQNWYQSWSQPRWDTWEVSETHHQSKKAAANWWDTLEVG